MQKRQKEFFEGKVGKEIPDEISKNIENIRENICENISKLKLESSDQMARV